MKRRELLILGSIIWLVLIGVGAFLCWYLPQLNSEEYESERYRDIGYLADGTRAVITFDRKTRHPVRAIIPVNYEDVFDVWLLGFYEWSGPVTKTFKRHGQWSRIVKKSLGVEYRWYWYGERCSEGDFHRWAKD